MLGLHPEGSLVEPFHAARNVRGLIVGLVEDVISETIRPTPTRVSTMAIAKGSLDGFAVFTLSSKTITP